MTDPREMTDEELMKWLREPAGAQQWPGEMDYLLRVLNRVQPKKVLEIGTGVGAVATLCAWKGADVLTVDARDPEADGERPDGWAWDLAGVADKIMRWVGDSHDLNVRDRIVAEGPFDLVLIDGDHGPDGRLDLDWYGPLAPVVGIHDICDYQAMPNEDWFPRHYWASDERKARRTSEFVDCPSGGWGFLLD